MKKISIEIGIITLLLAIFCFVSRIAVGNTLTVYFGNEAGYFAPTNGWIDIPEDMHIMLSRAGVVEAEKVKIKKDYIAIKVSAIAPGQTEISLVDENGEDISRSLMFLIVKDNMTVFNEVTRDFTGLVFYIIATGILYAAVCIILLRWFFKSNITDVYSYNAIFVVGLSILTGGSAMSVLHSLIILFINPYYFGVSNALQSIAAGATRSMIYLTPFMLVFSVAMIISNIELLRHESRRVRNVLGLLIPLALILGEAFVLFILTRDHTGSFEEIRFIIAISYVLCAIYLYFECILIASIICAVRAVRHKPAYDKDYILILGCAFRKDGTLTPLLKGRCDRAIEFWKEQKEKTGKEAVIIPSGGQGKDESMPEAEAMARYILSKGIPEECVMKEDQSKNTYQNMEFSKKLIDGKNPDAKVIFSTTNYHVFRSGLWSNLAGLHAEGIGGKTKWWFWPNAFMRECIGLVANRVKMEVFLLIIVMATYVALTYLTMN